jgi:hypothetical protein
VNENGYPFLYSLLLLLSALNCLTAVAAGLLEGQDSDYEGGEAFRYQPEVSN